MGKRVLSMMLILSLMFGTSIVARAADGEESALKNSLKSYGKMVYRDGTDVVVVDSSDLYMMADQIDLFKCRLTDQLKALNTYFTIGDGISLTTDTNTHVVHKRPSDADSVDPAHLNFDTLLEGVAVSQTVSSDAEAYGYPAGTKFYRKANGSLTTDGSETGTIPIDVAAASADNLSAGKAAWVDGRLILGTGADNKAYQDSGYVKGRDDGKTGTQPHEIDIKANGNRYVVPEDVSCAVIYISYRFLNYEGPSFRTADGSSVPNVLFWSSACASGEDTSGSYHYNGVMWFVPKLKANTEITVPGSSSGSYLYFFTE